MTTTIKDIARLMGVSHSTVSRALRGNSHISEHTTQRICQAALDMGYQPSAAARSLKTRRTQVLGVIVSSIADPFFSEILDGIEDCAQQGGYSLFIAASQHDPERERKIVQTMLEQRTDGVIICSSSFSAEQGRQLLTHDFPIVVVNHQSAESFHYSIYHDDMDGSLQITQHLIDLGHRKIAYLGNSQSGRTTLDRSNGCRLALENAGLSLPADLVLQVPGGDPDLGDQSVDHFMKLSDPPTAIVCFNDMLAIGILRGCRRAGVRVPDDLSITGFDNIAFSAFTSPPLTTFDQPKYSIGDEAAQLLLDLLENGNGKAPENATTKILKGRLLVRGSTGVPSRLPHDHHASV